MRLFKNALKLIGIIAVFSSCEEDDRDYTAYFGGEIANPRSRYVVLTKDDVVVDTLPLDEQNRFFAKFDSLAPGLYTFRHEPEYQYVYFEKNDSLLVSINANDFDKSLVFSGKGERKNNFLMDLYLMNEQDRNQSYRQYEKDYKSFIAEANKSYAQREAFYEKNKEDLEWSDDFDFYALNRLRLCQYTKKEYYPYIHARRTGKSITAQLPEDYYKFRKEIEYNNPKLTHFSPFLRYVNAMLSNLATAREGRTGNVEDLSLKDNIAKLQIADSIFTEKDIKNDILDNIAFTYLLESQNIENNKVFLEQYRKLSTNHSESNEIMQLANSIRNMTEGNMLPEVRLLDTNNRPFNFNGTNNGDETVIYFWTSCALSHYLMINEKIENLKKQFPDVEFVAINVDAKIDWPKTPKGFSGCKNVVQLRAANFDTLRDKWAINQLNRTIVLNPDGSIKNGFTDLMDEKFADYLK